ncbi:MAG: deoxyribonuclease IV, partial [Pseudomonadota bacterium]
MRFGFHLSIAGGLFKALDRGGALGCESGQIFSRNPRGWAGKPITPDEAGKFRETRARQAIFPLAIHLPYLPNPAAPAGELRDKSVRLLGEEMERAAILGVELVVFHPGHANPDVDPADAMARVAAAAAAALARDPASPAVLLLETTSNQKGELGKTFAELAFMLRAAEDQGAPPSRLGVCLDTAHVWAAGYDLTPERLAATLEEFDRLIGLRRLKLIHLNDSLSDRGGGRDRHAALGRGKIGAQALAGFIRHPALAHLPAVMETPRTSDEDDRANLALAKRWRDE